MQKNNSIPQKMNKKVTVDQFLARAESRVPKDRESNRGRLIFALDATASRQQTWDRAAQIQGEMFLETETLGTLEICSNISKNE